MRDPEQEHNLRHETLSPEDARALDRLMESGFADTAGDDRGARLMGLLGLLDTPIADTDNKQARIDLAIVMARRARSHDAEAMPALAELDAAAVDHWVERGVGDAPAELADRVTQLEAMATLGSAGAVEADRADRIARTMATIEADRRLQSERMRFEQGPELRGWRMRLADVVSIAAMLLIIGSVALPAINGVRNKQQMLACETNMQNSARAMGIYAGDNADYLPMATAGFGGSWMDVGTRNRSNSANLYTMVRTGYESLDDLACAGNAKAARGEASPDAWDWRSMNEISYSYRIMSQGGLRISVSVPTTTGVVVTADRSPVTLRAAQGLAIIPEANSPNHGQRGQFVLRLDGSSSFEKSPVVDGDNIWLPRPVEQVIQEARVRLGLIKGTEMPESATDAFVGP
jgi:hypothetical protein